MCILFIKLFKPARQGDFKLILASNRDELFTRPGKTAHFWEEDGNIFGGRDMTENKQGGTWLAMSKKGKLGVLLNVSGKPNPEKLGRGFLVSDFLKTSLSDREYLKKLMQNPEKYNAFHLVTATLGPKPSLMHCSNAGDSPGITEVDSDTFAVGNSTIGNPFKKVIKGREKFDEICSRYGSPGKKDELVRELLSCLKSEEKHYPDDVINSLPHLPLDFRPHYSALFVRSPNLPYGTRTHTIIVVDGKNKVEFHEWALKDPITPNHMEWVETHENFDLFPESAPSE